MSTVPATLDPHAWVLIAPFRSHFHALVETSGLPWQVVALGAPIPLATGRRLIGGPRRTTERIRRIDAVRVHALSPERLDALADHPVPAGPARVMLRRLRHQGSSLDQLAGLLHRPVASLEALATGSTDIVDELLEIQLRACCEDPLLLGRGTSLSPMTAIDPAA